MNGPAVRRDWTGLAVTVAGLIISATVAATSIYSDRKKYDSDQTAAARQHVSEQYSAFREAVRNEQILWKGFIDDYLSLIDAKNNSNADWRRAKALALYDLVNDRPASTFAEFEVPLDDRTSAHKLFEDSRRNILNGITDLGLQDNILREQLALRPRDKSLVASASPGNVAAATIVTTVEPAAPHADHGGTNTAITTREVVNAGLPAPTTPKTEIYSSLSPTGWDVDVFWCQGSAAQDNYQKAVLISQRLGALATDGRALGPGVRLGQVRSRPLAASFARSGPSPARGYLVVGDTGEGEEQVAGLLTTSINNLLGGAPFRRATSTGKPTKWYIGVFVCKPS